MMTGNKGVMNPDGLYIGKEFLFHYISNDAGQHKVFISLRRGIYTDGKRCTKVYSKLNALIQ